MWLSFKYSKGTNWHRGHKHEPLNTSAKVPHGDNFSSDTNLVLGSLLLQHHVKFRDMDWYSHATGLLRISIRRGIGFFIGQRDAKRKEMIDNLKKHTEDLIPQLRKWAEQPLAFSKEPLFLLAQQHIKGTESWEILEGNKGIRVLESQYTSLANEFRDQIQTSIEKQLKEKLPNFEIEHMDWFVEDTEQFIRKKLDKDKSNLFTFRIAQIPTTPTFALKSERSDGTMHRAPYLTGTEDNLKKLAEIMNNILNDNQIEQKIQDQRDIGKLLYEKRLSFAERMNLIISDITLGVSDEDRILFGKCKRCEGIKEKLRMN